MVLRPFSRRQILGLAAATVALSTGSSLLPRAARAQSAPPPGPFQNLATLHVKPANLADFLVAMRANAASSVNEPGNIAFNVYMPRSGAPTIYVLEQWQDQASYAVHRKQPALLAMHDAASKDVDGKIDSMLLTAATPGTGGKPQPVADAGKTDNVLAILKVQPNQRAALLQMIDPLVTQIRAAPGTVSFDCYQSTDDADTLVLMARWRNPAAYKAYLHSAANAKLQAAFKAKLAQPFDQSRIAVKDVTSA